MHCYASTSQVDGGWGLWRGSTQQHTLWEGYFILPYVGNCYCTFAHLWTAPVEGGWIIALFKSPIMSHLSGRSRVVPKVPRHHLSCSSRFLAYQSAIRTIGYALHGSPALRYECAAWKIYYSKRSKAILRFNWDFSSSSLLWSSTRSWPKNISTMMLFWMLLLGSILIEWLFWMSWTVIKTDVNMVSFMPVTRSECLICQI